MEKLLVDRFGRGVFSPDGSVVGCPGIPEGRLVWALPVTSPSSLLRRYQPSHPPGETCVFAMDFSFLVPRLRVLTAAALAIFTNTATSANAVGDWTVGPVGIDGRRVHALLAGGKAGTDYRLVWTVTVSDGSVWPRTGLMLCSDVA